MSATMTREEMARAMAAQGIAPNKIEEHLMYMFPTQPGAERASNYLQVVGPTLPFPVRVTLPWSALCSDNRKYSPANRKGVGRMVMRPEYREAKEKARRCGREAMTVEGKAFPPLARPLSLVARVWMPDNREGHDVANFAKCAHDALEKAVYATDAWLHDIRWIRVGVDVDRPRAEIEVRPL